MTVQGFEVRRKDREAIQQSRILIIDDQPSNIVLLEKILEYNGYRQYRSITDSKNAIREFETFQPDLVLLDLMMPEVDGYEILSGLQPLIRNDTYLPILVITADASQKAKQRALSLGTKDFITKPIDATETILRIENLLRTRWLYGQVRRQAEDLLEANGELRAKNRELTGLRDGICSLMNQADGALSEESEPHLPQTADPDAMLTRIGELIRARKRLEEDLRQAQKMEAMGRLAAGIAHDFNNLLTVICGYNDLLRQDLQQSPKSLEHAMEVSHAAGRASALTKQLLAFSRRQIARPRVVDVNSVVGQMEKMLRRILEENIELEIVPGAAVYAVKVDPAQLDQVLMNLVVNARDAMPLGGRLRIETNAVELTEYKTVRLAGLRPGSYVVLAVTDTGTGMNRETQARLFEPFYTTKEKGKGTGLGLSIVHGIVSQSAGHIEVESELGRGTTFRIYLPATEEEEGEALFTDVPPPRSCNSETILLVEDDQHVRRLAREILVHEGYDVWEAVSGNHALESAREKPGRVRLLLTDLVMPAMSGCDLARELTALQPGIRVLYMSGYADTELAHRAELRPESALLEKPFTAATLREGVRRALND